uniref:INCENP_ARK-bind domain-containing protein n=1 Tax=Parastrongyloides trichosuri TaxID=131310 RepID=A0A0N4ZH81_PARTI
MDSHSKSIRKTPSNGSKSRRKKLSQKDLISYTKLIEEERERRKKAYQEAERKKIKKNKKCFYVKKKNRLQKDGSCGSEYSTSSTLDVTSIALNNISEALLQACKEKVLETKIDSKVNPENNSKYGGVVKSQKESTYEKKVLPDANSTQGSQKNVSKVESLCPTISVGSPVLSPSGRDLRPSKNLLKEKSGQLILKTHPGVVKKRKKNFDSVGAKALMNPSKTIDMSHPYAVLNCREDVMKSKLKYLHKNNNHNNWDIYDNAGIPFWSAKQEDDDSDDSTSDTIPLNSTALLDVEQGKIELPEYIEEPNDLNPFQPLRGMIERNPIYFETNKICLTTLRSMAALHLKDLPSKTKDFENTNISNKSTTVTITDIRDCVSYPRWDPKSTVKCKFTGEVWPIKTTSS